MVPSPYESWETKLWCGPAGQLCLWFQLEVYYLSSLTMLHVLMADNHFEKKQ